MAMLTSTLFAQTNNPISIYEGTLVQSIDFKYTGLPTDSNVAAEYMRSVETTFVVPPQSQFNSLLAAYYVSKINLLPFVTNARINVTATSQNEIAISISVAISPTVHRGEAKRENATRNVALLPVLYNSGRTFVTLKAAASEMAYSNDNAWFAQPAVLTNGNPLATSPVGAGYTGWLEGFASAGVYGIVKVIPSINLHIYGGANYLVSYSAGAELFTNKSRIHGDIEEAFVGIVGGGRASNGKMYRYNATYGRKQFTLGDGWLIINTSMNGDNRAALQLNPRWASKRLIQAGVQYGGLFLQGFRLEPNELPILNSHTVINGLNLELRNSKNALLGFSFLSVPSSGLRYYLPDGTTHTREGMQVYNVRLFKSARQGSGLFFKAEGGYERNTNFDMSAWAYYGELGWAFGKVKGTPTFSYRYAYFSGDDPDTKSYNRWDALYTGGNGEQWVQGSNMYKIVQNSNEISHRFQGVYNPIPKIQFVGQVWLFYAPQTNNLGGNPALSVIKSRYYGSEYNLTIKYFRSRSWYFHLNTAYTIAGGAIRNNVPNSKDWFCLSAFARYSF